MTSLNSGEQLAPNDRVLLFTPSEYRRPGCPYVTELTTVQVAIKRFCKKFVSSPTNEQATRKSALLPM